MAAEKICFLGVLLVLTLACSALAGANAVTNEVDYTVTSASTAVVTNADDSVVSSVECKKYVDEEGCTVKVCSNGREEKYCDSEVSCEKHVDEKACVIEKCSDGSITRKCPSIASTCEKVVDEDGCITVKCGNSVSERYCPDVECKRYVDEEGCIVKQCTDGTRDRDCPEARCPTETELERMKEACRGKGLNALAVQDSQGCRNIKCVGECPVTTEEAEERIRKCKAYGLSYNISFDEFGCKNVVCNSLENAQTVAVQAVNCKEVKDEATGFVRRVCEHICEEISSEKKLRCVEAGGTPEVAADSRGCNYVQCNFPETDAGNASECVPMEKLKEVEEECRARGLVPKYAHDLTGCRKVECGEETEASSCGRIPLEELREKKSACAGRGGRLLEEFDDHGCPSFICRNPGETCEEVPDEAYARCEEAGGTMLVKEDEEGCVVYSECLRRGVEPGEANVEKVLDEERIRALAAKLDRIMEELGKLGEKALEISEYYEEQGDTEKAEKFEKAAMMIRSAMGRVSELKEKLEGNAENMTVETLKEIKNEVRHLKEVVLKDIIYVMLSKEDETSEDEGPCADIDCFKRALRICKKHKMVYSEDGTSVEAEVTGFESGACKFKVKMKKENQELEMVCDEPNHAFAEFEAGHLSEICNGTLADSLKAMKSNAQTAVSERKVERRVE